MTRPRKKRVESESLFANVPLAPPVRRIIEAAPQTAPSPTPAPSEHQEQLEEDIVIDRRSDGRFVVAILRHQGTTVAAVVYTRSQLELLRQRISQTLEAA